jgi:hypothetical protein
MRIRILDPGIFLTLDPGPGMEKNSDPGYGIKLPDPQHCFYDILSSLFLSVLRIRISIQYPLGQWIQIWI